VPGVGHGDPAPPYAHAVPTTRVNGIDLYYERRGQGPRLLFLNGSGADLATTAPLLQPFFDRFDTMAHDQRGLGRTSIAPGPYTMADYAGDAAALLDHEGWDRCRVVGISFGGMVAQELAATWPERVERLALACTSPGGAGGASYPLHELAALPEEEQAATGLRILDTRFTGEWLDDHPDDRMVAELMAARRLAPKTDEQLRGEAEQLGARRHHDVCDGWGGSLARRWWRAGATTASRRSPTVRRSRDAFPRRRCGCTRAGTPSSSRTAPPCPRSSTSSPADARSALAGYRRITRAWRTRRR
jgi:3-oxoadipate enol-lactonase